MQTVQQAVEILETGRDTGHHAAGGTDRLDLVQFHWWDYAAPRWLETLGWLKELKAAGKIDRIGGTNFDSDHVAAIVEAGIPFTALQLQYSLLDRRPEKRMADLARESGFDSVKDLLEIARHGRGNKVYLIRFHYLPPGAW